MRAARITLLTLSLGTLAGCAADEPTAEVPIPYADPDPAPGRPTTDAAAGVLRSGPFERKFAGIAFSVPTGWQEAKLVAEQPGFVDARFVIPADEGTVEITCLSSGGGVDANFHRWIGQFTFPPGERESERTVKVDGVEARWIDLFGTFNASSSGKPGPHPDWRMIGVAIPLGEKDFYLKLNGPDAAVAKVEERFEEFVKTARLEK